METVHAAPSGLARLDLVVGWRTIRRVGEHGVLASLAFVVGPGLIVGVSMFFVQTSGPWMFGAPILSALRCGIAGAFAVVVCLVMLLSAVNRDSLIRAGIRTRATLGLTGDLATTARLPVAWRPIARPKLGSVALSVLLVRTIYATSQQGAAYVACLLALWMTLMLPTSLYYSWTRDERFVVRSKLRGEGVSVLWTTGSSALCGLGMIALATSVDGLGGRDSRDYSLLVAVFAFLVLSLMWQLALIAPLKGAERSELHLIRWVLLSLVTFACLCARHLSKTEGSPSFGRETMVSFLQSATIAVAFAPPVLAVRELVGRKVRAGSLGRRTLGDNRVLPDSSHGRISGVAVTKLSVSLDEDIAEAVKQAAHDEGVTVSAWVSASAQARIRNRLLREAIAEAASDLTSFDDETIESLVDAARAKAIFTDLATAG